MKKQRFAIIMALFLLSATGMTLRAAADNYIVGGKRVGPVLLGQPVEKYEKILGPRSTINPKLYDYPNRQFALFVENGKITGIMVYGKNYKTKEGVTVGMPLSALEKHYGKYLKTDAGSLVYTEMGLAFNEKDDKISRIMVVQATPDILLGDKIIVPGERAGQIKIGMDISGVEKYWGQPKTADPLPGNDKIRLYNYDTKAVNIMVSDGIVHGVRINSYKYKTAEGIGMDSSQDQVINTYGKRYSEVGESIFYNHLGIGFYFEKGKVIEVLLTYRKE